MPLEWQKKYAENSKTQMGPQGLICVFEHVGVLRLLLIKLV